MHAHYYTLIVIGATFLILFFVTSAFHTLMPQECVCVGGGRGGGAEIFIYIRRLGPFLGVQNLEFQYFLGGFRNMIILGGMKILWIYHNKIGLVLEVISIHFRDFRGFLKVNVQDGDIILGSPKLQIFFGVWLIFPIYFGGRQ